MVAIFGFGHDWNTVHVRVKDSTGYSDRKFNLTIMTKADAVNIILHLHRPKVLFFQN